MYHCHVQFYLLTHQEEDFDAIRAMPPLEAFTHDFFVSGSIQSERLERADVILADLRGQEARAALAALTAGMGEKAQLILLAEYGQAEALGDALERAWDVWRLPMTERELRFRFLRLATGVQADQGRMADQLLFGGDHQPHPQPDLV